MKPGIKSVASKLNGKNWKINIHFSLKDILCLNLNCNSNGSATNKAETGHGIRH